MYDVRAYRAHTHNVPHDASRRPWPPHTLTQRHRQNKNTSHAAHRVQLMCVRHAARRGRTQATQSPALLDSVETRPLVMRKRPPVQSQALSKGCTGAEA